jgi:hypothetical protein
MSQSSKRTRYAYILWALTPNSGFVMLEAFTGKDNAETRKSECEKLNPNWAHDVQKLILS